MKTKVKICGIRTSEQAFIAYEAGADFLGLQFVPSSKRVVDVAEARKMSDRLKGKIPLVGVFQNQPPDEVNRISREINLDYAQLHGNEDIEYCKKMVVPVIKSFCLPFGFDPADTLVLMKKYIAAFFLIDREKRGEGKMLPIKNAALLANTYPVFLAGGLTPENVLEAVKNVKPYAVDVASGIETEGIPDSGKIRLFIQHAKQ